MNRKQAAKIIRDVLKEHLRMAEAVRDTTRLLAARSAAAERAIRLRRALETLRILEAADDD